jgi:Tfp pilus assembly protein FimT
VAMLGILAAVAVPTFAPDAASHLESAGAVVAGDLAYVRSLAVANGSKYRLSFDGKSNKYTLTHSGTNPALNTLPSGPIGVPSDPATQKTTDLSQLLTLGSRVKLLGVQRGTTGALQDVLEFNALGATSSAAQTTIWLTAGSGADTHYIDVNVNPVTGLATRGTAASTAPPVSFP